MIYSIIVTYNPDLKLLEKQFHALCLQVDALVYIDNGSRNLSDIKRFIEKVKKVQDIIIVVYNKKNIGLGAAQNQGIDIAMANGIDHVVFFDQDSTPEQGFISKMLKVETKLLSQGKRVGVVAPTAIEEGSGKICGVTLHERWCKRQVFPQEGEFSVLWVMASGSLFRTEVFHTIGKMNPHFFVDMIDTEWGYRAKAKGYEVFVTAGARLFHNVGDSSKNIGGRTMHIHHPYRLYYHARNNIVQLYNPVYKRYRFRVITKTFARVLVRIGLHVILVKNGMEYLKYGIQGIVDGFMRKLGPYGDTYKYRFDTDS
ncbi:glycosyltransferase family 2 protein [uncultured Parabacteroides sp.]|uniref:glycosyltransferase family 2 protein n=1 Tax=uncultured Parabacteroides sp. TaxID=512312 RepID=UPI0026273F03|nr:glycosyltransferase family 2 protein [uncultured Parabacteroides sp.]